MKEQEQFTGCMLWASEVGFKSLKNYITFADFISLNIYRLLRRARYASKITAEMMTQPVTNLRVGSCTPICARPAPSTAINNTPKKVLIIEPRPPDKLVPPMTHAAMACNSAPLPAFGSAEERRAHCRIAAHAASNPLKANTATLIGRGLIPE